MKLSACVSVVVLSCIGCVVASPMFGATGMMKRRFPGATDMSYNTYMNIASSNRQGEVAPVFVGQPGAASANPSSDDWMFTNSIAPEPTANSGLALRTNFFNRRPSVPSNTVQDIYTQQYPTAFVPRQSFAELYFPQQSVDTRYGRPYNAYYY